MKHALFLVCLLAVAARCAFPPAQAFAAGSDVFARSTQMIVVTTANWDAVEGRLQRFERSNAHETWRPAGEPIPIVVGKNGMGWGIGLIADDDAAVRAADEPVKKEGDGKSPAGVFALGTAFGYAAEPLAGLKMSYLPLTPSIECVDDVGSKYYNHIVDRAAVAPDWRSSEHMLYTGEAYRWGVVLDHNGTVEGRNAIPPAPGSGSCVFLHIWHSRDQGTAGCTAMTQANLEMLLLWLDPANKPVVVQLPQAAYARLAGRWMLPDLSKAASR
jgi:zinc D-Ala-D-Ala dipeptidase